ncbi:MAG TPA: hypothetical protein V6D07_09775 [Trichocoleus sp.]
MQSLSAFAQEHNLPKSTVHKRAKALDIDTSKGLSESAQSILLKEFGLAPTVEVCEGNHKSAIELHPGSSAANLEQFRTDRNRFALSNPKQFVTELTGFLDQIEEGMELAEQQQEQELQQVRQVKRQTVQRVQSFRRRADEYRLRTDILASIQNAELDELQDLAAEVSELGKSSTGSGESLGGAK